LLILTSGFFSLAATLFSFSTTLATASIFFSISFGASD